MFALHGRHKHPTKVQSSDSSALWVVPASEAVVRVSEHTRREFQCPWEGTQCMLPWYPTLQSPHLTLQSPCSRTGIHQDDHLTPLMSFQLIWSLLHPFFACFFSSSSILSLTVPQIDPRLHFWWASAHNPCFSYSVSHFDLQKSMMSWSLQFNSRITQISATALSFLSQIES